MATESFQTAKLEPVEKRPTLASRRARLGSVFERFYQAQESGGKALPYRIELTDAGGPLLSGGGPSGYNSYNGFNSGASVSNRSPLSQREAAIHLQTYGGSEAIDWLYDALNFTVTSASSADWRFDDAGKELAILKQPNDPPDTKLAPPLAVKLFKNPNPYMLWEDLCELTLIDYLLVGNAYWVKWQVNADNQPLALYRMAPQYVKIKPGQFGPEKYLYRLPGQSQDTEFDPDKVVHFKRPNPHDPYYGLGLVQGAARALDMEIELTKTAASYYEKQALPSGVVQTERRVPRDVFNKLKNQLRSFYARSSNAGQLMVLEAGLQYKPISPTAQEAMFQVMGEWSRERIFAMFHLNRALLGLWQRGDNPNLGQWQTLFDQKTMLPLTKRFAKRVSEGVTQPGWGIDFCIDYQETQQPDDVLNRAGTVAKLPGVMVHEVRDAAGLAPSTGDEEIDKTVLNMPQPNMDENGAGGAADQPLPGENGAPPKQENTTQFQRRNGTRRAPAARAGGTSGRTPGKKSLEQIGSEMEDLMAQLEARERTLDMETALAAAKALSPADHVHIGKLQGKHVTPPQDVLFAKRTAALDAAVNEIQLELTNAVTMLERGLMDAAEGKAEGTIYMRVKNSSAWTKFRDKLEEILMGAAQGSLASANAHHGAQGLNHADIDYEAEAKSLAHRQDGGVASLMKTIKKRVGDAVLEKQRKGAPNADIQAALQEQIAEWKTNSAPQIALDTAAVSYNSGTLAVAEENGSTEVLVSDGEDFDEPCIQANGETWTIEQARSNMQEHSRCKRAFVPVVS